MPRILITLGDPAGIGPEVVEKALASGQLPAGFDFEVLGDATGCVPGHPDARSALRARFPTLAKRLPAVQAADDAKPHSLHVQAVGAASMRHFPARDNANGFLALGLFGLAGCVLLIASFNNSPLQHSLERADAGEVR